MFPMGVPTERMMSANWSGVPIGLMPDGTLVFCYDQLPVDLVPTRVVIHPTFFEVDGWTLAYSGICKGTLDWFRNRLDLWMQAEPALVDHEWCQAVMDRMIDAIQAST